MDGTVAEVNAALLKKNKYALEKEIKVELPPPPNSLEKRDTTRLTIIKGTYGHPHDMERTFDVTEKIQGLTDARGGTSFFCMDRGESLSELFGEPCTSVNKVISFTYKIDGKAGDIVAPEAHGYLVEPIRVKAPVIAPALIVTFATLSPKLLVGRTFGAQGDAKTRLLNYTLFDKKSAKAKKTSIRCLDSETVIVTDEVRGLVDSCGGYTIDVYKGNDIFTTALSRMKLIPHFRERFKNKELVLEIECRIHEKLKNIKIYTDGKHIITKDFSVNARPAEPMLTINAAVYGHPTDTERQVNVKHIVEKRVKSLGGSMLAFETNENLLDLFGDPCYPYHTTKVLQIRYAVKEVRSQVSACVGLDGRLSQNVRIGWPIKEHKSNSK